MWKTNRSRIKDLELEVKGMQNLMRQMFNALPEHIEDAVKKAIDQVRDEEKVRRLNGGTGGSITRNSFGQVTGTRHRERAPKYLKGLGRDV